MYGEQSQNGLVSVRESLRRYAVPNAGLLTALDRVRARRCAILGFGANQKADDLDASILAVLRAGYEVKLPDQ